MKGVRPDRIVTIPVWSRATGLSGGPRSEPAAPVAGTGWQFVAMYSGNLGLAHSFDEFLEAARRLRHRQDIVFLFVGAGPRAVEVHSARDREGLANVRLLDYVPRAELHRSLSLADVHLISMRPEMTGIVVPGKLYGVMAAGRPALFVGPAHCESADTIRRAGCGFTIAPGDADGVVAALTKLAADLNLARQMGQKGRHLPRRARANLCCYQWIEVMRDLVPRPAAWLFPRCSPRWKRHGPGRPAPSGCAVMKAARSKHTLLILIRGITIHSTSYRPDAPARGKRARCHEHQVALDDFGLVVVLADPPRPSSRPLRASPRSSASTIAP